jgi:DNA-directed RNA polymerase alpha subunit
VTDPSIPGLDIKVRATPIATSLRRHGIHTIADFDGMTMQDIINIPGIGPATAISILLALADAGATIRIECKGADRG